MEDLKYMDEDDLKGLGLPAFKIRRFLAEVQKFEEEEEEAEEEV